MIRATHIVANIVSMVDVLDKLAPLFLKHNQISVTARPGALEPLIDGIGWLPEGASESDYSIVTEPFIGTEFERILGSLPFAYGRTRLMRLRPKTCLSVHADPSPRYHLALITNPGCYIIGVSGDKGNFHHIPADGKLYEMDAHRTHTALNSGGEDRIHLVICPALAKRPDDADPVGRN